MVFAGMNERFVPLRHNEDLVDLRENKPQADGKAWSPLWRASKIDDMPVFAAILPCNRKSNALSRLKCHLGYIGLETVGNPIKVNAYLSVGNIPGYSV